MIELSPEVILKAYMHGIFPMAESADSTELYWFDPEQRGILPLNEFHVPRRLARTLRQRPFAITHDRAFDAVLEGCATPAPGRRETWINSGIKQVYRQLHDRGHAHSIEAWEIPAAGGHGPSDDGGRGDEDGERANANGRAGTARLVGGLYGVAIGGAFFGESMFSFRRDASKICLVYLVARLVAGGFRLLDTQFVTSHLARFGARSVYRAQYHRMLDSALGVAADFYCGEDDALAFEFLQSRTQTS